MQKTLKVLLILNAAILAWNLGSSVHAQQPPQANVQGVPYLSVNINPTNTPPMVNINPQGAVPKVEVARMPEVSRVEITPTGCDSRLHFVTAVGRSINGPLVVTYLNLPAPTPVTLVGTEGGGNQRITLSNTTTLASAIYLKAGQRMDFENEVMYSGCQPQ